MATSSLSMDDIRATLPDMSRPVTAEGVGDSIEILRDAHGIPHIRARSFHDAFFGQGFATAQDRLWHMDHDRHTAYGRWAEIVGESGVEQDLSMRRLQIARSVEDDYTVLNLGTKTMLDAYAAGVNAYIEGPDPLPIEYRMLDAAPEPWQPWDCLAVFMVRHILMGVYEGKLWRARLVNELGAERASEIIPAYPDEHLLITPPGEEYGGGAWQALAQLSAGKEHIGWLSDVDAGSNNWAVSGSRTASGKPLVAGDPHRPLDTPNVYYQNHVACPEFDAIGLSFPGCPGFPHFGHNAHVAWCVTHAQADYQDLYIERFKEGSPSEYLWDGEWTEAEVRREVVEIKGGNPVDIDILVTRHGPIIAGDPESGHGIALRYTATDGPNRWSECLPRMLKARSADGIDEAMRHWVDPCNNFVFADVHGDIGYLNRGRLPVRSELNAWLPVPGWKSDYEWKGFVPFEELARSRNPDTGYIVTANNRIAPGDFPHYIALHYSPDYRARRITHRLQGLDRVTVEDMAAIHGERVSIPAMTYARLLAEAEPLDELSARAQKKLAGWDGAMDRDSVAAAIYSASRIYLDGVLLEHQLGRMTDEALSATGRGAPMHVSQLKALFVTAAGNNDASVLPPGDDWSSVAARALADGVASLREKLGDDMDSWTWGSVHSTSPHHTLSEFFPEMAVLLDPPPVPMGGDGDTPHSSSYAAAGPFTVTGTSAARYVFDTADWDNSRWIVPLGASGNPASPHYADQTPVWEKIEMVPMLYGWELIEKQAESRQRVGARG
jgi:penicillin amidase